MANGSMQHGTGGASAHAFGILGHDPRTDVFAGTEKGYRFAKLACELVEKHGFIAYHAKVYHAMGLAAQWAQPITTVIDLMRATSRTAIETGDWTFACYSLCQSVHGAFVRNDSLDAVWRELEMALDFAGKAGFRDMAETIVSQQRFIATMQGRTATFSTFSDSQFDEAAFEARLTRRPDDLDGLPLLDRQTEDAVPVRGLRRGARGGRKGKAAALGLGRLDPVTRLLLLQPR